MKKPPAPQADAGAIARATLTAADYQKINEAIAPEKRTYTAHTKSVQAVKTAKAAESSARSGSEDAAHQLPPTSNTGGKKIRLVCEGGKVKEVLQRTHSENEICFIDWVNVTCHESSFQWMGTSVTDEQLIAEVSRQCELIFGFGITEKRDRGANFYNTSFTLGNKYGLICYGGQRNTVLIMINGEGCAASKHGWERRFFNFLTKQATTPRITRLDLSHDDIEGKLFTPESLEEAYDNGEFNNGGRNPDIEHRGNWKHPNGKGRTLYVGKRTNGKFFRGYEKGKQLGGVESPWIRLEVELKSVDRVIPFDALLRPQDYFAASYPIFEFFSATAERILTVQKTVEVSYERTKAWLKHQCGPALNLMLQIEGDAKSVLKLVMREGKTPKGVEVPSYLTAGEFLHNLEKSVIPTGYIEETFGSY